MSYFVKNDVSIYYEDSGEDLPALLILAPGGMKSSLDFWHNTPWDPRKELFQKYRVIAMDQRNAGRSVAPVTAEDGWQCYIEDQIGLVDHLGIDKFNVAGMCIGGPYCLGIIDAVPSRVISATIFQTIGLDGNREAFYRLFDEWADEVSLREDNISRETFDGFRTNMFGSNKVFFNLDESFLPTCNTPLLVLLGNDLFHPSSSSELIVNNAPNTQLIDSWKDGESRDAAILKCEQFLDDYNH